MAFKATGPGKVQNLKGGDGEVNGLLFNFDIDGVILKPDHMKWLASRVVPMLKAGGSVTLVARASRTGENLINKLISQERLKQTVKYLKREVVAFKYKDLIAEGELHALKLGVRDGDEGEVFRAVQVAAWKKPEPPPPPPPPPAPSKAPEPVKFAKRIKSRIFEYKIESTSSDDDPGSTANDLSENIRYAMNPTSTDNYVEIPAERKLTSVYIDRTDKTKRLVKTKEITVTYHWGSAPLAGVNSYKGTESDSVMVKDLDGIPRYYKRSVGERWLNEAGHLLFQPHEPLPAIQ